MMKPKLLTMLKGYTKEQFGADAMAGLIVGIVAIPLAIAFAIASGVSPEKGLITAIVGGLIVSLLGGSRVQIAGPTGAFVVIVFGIVQKYGMEGLCLASIMGGVLLLIMGFTGLGAAIKFVPYPVVVGFTSGIALIIFSTQVKDFLGLQIPQVPAEFLPKWQMYFQQWDTVNPYALGIGLLSLGITIFWGQKIKRFPGSLVAILAATLVVYFFKLPVETIGTRFGEIPHTFPAPVFPTVSLQLLRDLSSSALAIALLAGIESLLSAVVADGMVGGKHRSNMELVAQGTANIVSPLLGGIPVTGAIARTVTNINNGGRTPVAGVIHSVVLLLAMLFLGKYVSYIPLAALAAILFVVAYNMSEWRTFGLLLKSPRSDVAVLCLTFILTVVIDLTVALEVGVFLSIFLFMKRMTEVTSVDVYRQEWNEKEAPRDIKDSRNLLPKDIPVGVEVYEINGPFFFGAAYKFLEAMNEVGRKPKVRIIRMRHVLSIDATGLNALWAELKNSRRRGIAFVIAGIHTQPFLALDKAGLLDAVGRDNVFRSVDEALKRAEDLVSTHGVSHP